MQAQQTLDLFVDRNDFLARLLDDLLVDKLWELHDCGPLNKSLRLVLDDFVSDLVESLWDGQLDASTCHGKAQKVTTMCSN
jgi:hypothetical protein